MLSIIACVFSVHIYIPNMPVMAEAFNCSQEMMQLSISVGVLGTSLTTPFIGPLSDTVGRWKVLLFSQQLFMLACFATYFANTIEAFLVFRFIQGIGGAAAFTVGFACVTDLFQGSTAARYLSYLTSTMTLSLVIAPLLGGFLASYFPWQSTFLFMSFLAVISVIALYTRFRETLQTPMLFSVLRSLKAYGHMLMHPKFMVMATIPSIMIGGIIVFMSTGAFFFIKKMGFPASLYGILQCIIMLSNTAASIYSASLIQRFGLMNTTRIGLSLFISGSIGFLLSASWFLESTAMTILAISLYAAGLGLTFNIMTSQAMEMFRHNAGTASAAINFMRGIIISGCTALGGQLYDETLWPTAAFLTVIAAITLVMNLLGSGQKATVNP